MTSYIYSYCRLYIYDIMRHINKLVAIFISRSPMNVKKSVLEKKSDGELLKYLNPESKFVSDAILMSYEILKSRGVIFQNEETLRIKNLIERAKIKEKVSVIQPWDKYSEENQDLIALYSEKIIWIYTTIFGVIFGAVLLSINLYRLNKKKEIAAVSFFGILYPIIQFYLFNYLRIELDILKTLLSNAVGATVLQFVFWQKYIQNDKIIYRKEGVTPMLIFIIVIFIGWNFFRYW